MTQTTGRIVKRDKNDDKILPEIGKIKIGEKDSRGLPTSLPYFRATGNFSQDFYSLHGDKPTSIPLVFPSNNIKDVCNERFEAWKSGKCWGRGDGETFEVWDSESKKYIPGIKKDDPRVRALGSDWKPMLTLRFILLKMRGVMGVWSFETSGKLTTIPSIVQSFDYVRERTNGVITSFPFSLQVNIKKGYSPTDPKKYPMVTLVPNFSEENIELVRDYIAQGMSITDITTKMVVGDSSTKLLNNG